MTKFQDWQWDDPPAANRDAHRKACVKAANLVVNELKRDFFIIPYWKTGKRPSIGVTVLFGQEEEMRIRGDLKLLDVAPDYGSEDVANLIGTLRSIADKLEAKLRKEQGK